MATTRKSTPKHTVQTVDSGVVVYGPASKTDCKRIAGKMNTRKRKVVWVVSVARNMAVA